MNNPVQRTGCTSRLDRHLLGGGKLLANVSLSIVCALALYSAGLRSVAYAQSPATGRRAYGAANCRVESPNDWRDVVHIVWIGGCKDGHAQGLGVLVREDKGFRDQRFLGRVDQGYLRVGALDLGGRDYRVGPWENGSVTRAHEDDPGYRGYMMDVYEEAAKAADATAKYMARHSKPRAARFYKHLAKDLRFQLDE